MPDEPNKQKPILPDVEWSFSFEQFGDSVAQLLAQLGIGADADLQTATLTEPLGNAARANIRLELTVGRVTLGALPVDSDHLIEARVVSIGAVEMRADTEGDSKSVRLRQKRQSGDDLLKPMKDAVDTVAHNNELEWEIRLSPRLPITLELHAALTVESLDLRGLNVPRFKLNGGTGKTDVTLPDGISNARISGGVGLLTIHVPDGAQTTLELDIGAGATYLNIGEASLKANIEGGVGNCNVVVPDGAALRVRADSGLGNIIVPDWAESVSLESEFISESGTWETPSYEFASQKIDLRYDGGVGSLIVETRHEDTPTHD